ncbi:MAG: D-glycero-beta-D-manno-heptose 1-phosphate adenylyltransferase [Deltaproteobacteria bacterium]|nr:D-glycero-beta-D-manno-heptose 1-phosphate adenylyltransferase [Deltaproteobacteria bacterium]
MDLFSKIKACSELAPILRGLRASGKVVVFTNGCFDLLHAGHVRYLEAARREGDILVVGLNSDRSVRDIKGDKRPILREPERAEVLAGLAAVNYVVRFDEPDPLRLITALAPDVLVKGGDWPEEAIIGAQEVRNRGGRVVRIPVMEGASTSAVIARILERYGD